MSKGAKIRIAISFAVAIIGVAALFIFAPTPASRTGIVLSGPEVGGPFTLIDHHGQTVTDGDFRGDYMLIYFGYTYCPDVCPTSLQFMVTALDLLGDEGAQIRPIFITIDPERDTPAALADYVALFHPRLVGLTGTPEQVAAAAKLYHVYYKKAVSEVASEYLMNHSSQTFLMAPEGRFLKFFGHGADPETIAAGIREYL